MPPGYRPSPYDPLNTLRLLTAQQQDFRNDYNRANMDSAIGPGRLPMSNISHPADVVPPGPGSLRQAEGNPLRIGRNVYDVPGEMQRPPSSLREMARGALLAQRQAPRQRAHVPITPQNYSPVMPGRPAMNPEDILGALRQRRTSMLPTTL